MKNEILEISGRLELGLIDHKVARQELCDLFEVKYKPLYKGRAIVRGRKQKFIYDGHELKIIGLYMTYNNGSGMGIYPDGTREFILSLEGTEFEGRYSDNRTVLAETDLEILEVEEL